jgi:hypothetical protein
MSVAPSHTGACPPEGRRALERRVPLGGGPFDASCTWSDAHAATHDSLRAAKKPQLVYKHVGMRRNGKDQPPSRLSKKYAQPMPGHRSGLSHSNPEIRLSSVFVPCCR